VVFHWSLNSIADAVLTIIADARGVTASRESSPSAAGSRPRAAAAGAPGGRRRSYLLRVWEEPRERAEDAPLARAMVRDLETGEERCFGEPSRMGSELVEYLFSASPGAVVDRGEKASDLEEG
jgi:hypothetical protein